MINFRLKAMIVKCFGSQVDFAQALRIQAPMVSQVVRGRKFLSHEDRQRWADRLGCKPEDIFSECTDARDGGRAMTLGRTEHLDSSGRCGGFSKNGGD
jgi:transcriptional regulator with XRE-family HTH domain